MFRIIFFVLLVMMATQGWAESLPGVDRIALSRAPIDRSDKESIRRGAKMFANTCMSCHTMKYLRYDKVAQEAGITMDRMPLNVTNWPYGVIPPDMSLEASVRGVDWVYTYLHSFYKDASRPTGVNNLLVHNSAMSGILMSLQGEQVLTIDRPDLSVFSHTIYWYDLVTLASQGSMTPEEFDRAMADIVNFLAYAAEPYHEQQQHLGYWVLGFLFIFLVLVFLLKREYWKDVKKHRDE